MTVTKGTVDNTDTVAFATTLSSSNMTPDGGDPDGAQYAVARSRQHAANAAGQHAANATGQHAANAARLQSASTNKPRSYRMQWGPTLEKTKLKS